GPNNAVLVLAGDIDAETARPLVERYFGDIPRGPDVAQTDPGVPTLDERREVVMQDQVAQTRLYRTWIVPGLNDPAATELDIAASVFGGLASSRLDNILVRDEQTATGVRAFVVPFEYNSIFEVQVDVAPSADADAVAARLDELLGDFIAQGPTEDEVDRVAMTEVAGRIAGLEQVGGFGGKAVVLAQGELYSDDPAYYRTQLERYGAATPESVTAAMQRWLTRPVLALRVVPGEREEYQEAGSVEGDRTGGMRAPAFYLQPGEEPVVAEPAEPAEQAPELTRSEPRPEVGEIGDLDFPDVERAELSNGIAVVFARRDTVPRVHVALQFDAGYAADSSDRLGLQSLMAGLLDEGTTSLDSTQIAEARERLGAAIAASSSLDRTTVTLAALTPNLAPSLDLMADIVQNPAFAEREIERVRAQRLAGIASELTQPVSIALRNLPPLLYPQGHPYGIPFTGSGTPETVRAITRDDIIAAHRRWIRPDKARIFVVGDTTLEEILPMLDARFGDWRTPSVAGGEKSFPEAAAGPQSRIVLIDRPQSPQSIIFAGSVLPVAGTDDLVLLNAANEALGGDFLARLNMDLRETKGWAYGAYGFLSIAEENFPYIVYAPVQADRTGDSIRAIQQQYAGFLGENGLTPAELERIRNGNIRELPGSYETAADVLNGLRNNANFDRSDDYQETLADRYRAMSAGELDSAIRAVLDPDNFIWVVVGEAESIRSQLDALGLDVEVREAQ
ncbi:MAG: insulinase family protein, partial [Sphingomonadales bacterium]|nr:insulinase family protein [Sphingomonadales bacterium]